MERYETGINKDDDMRLPYFIIVDRKEVFGKNDKGTASVIRLITNKADFIEELKPATASSSEKQEWTKLKNDIESGTKFVECSKKGYFEFDSKLSENEIKLKLEAIGFH